MNCLANVEKIKAFLAECHEDACGDVSKEVLEGLRSKLRALTELVDATADSWPSSPNNLSPSRSKLRLADVTQTIEHGYSKYGVPVLELQVPAHMHGYVLTLDIALAATTYATFKELKTKLNALIAARKYRVTATSMEEDAILRREHKERFYVLLKDMYAWLDAKVEAGQLIIAPYHELLIKAVSGFRDLLISSLPFYAWGVEVKNNFSMESLVMRKVDNTVEITGIYAQERDYKVVFNLDELDPVIIKKIKFSKK